MDHLEEAKAIVQRIKDERGLMATDYLLMNAIAHASIAIAERLESIDEHIRKPWQELSIDVAQEPESALEEYADEKAKEAQ